MTTPSSTEDSLASDIVDASLYESITFVFDSGSIAFPRGNSTASSTKTVDLIAITAAVPVFVFIVTLYVTILVIVLAVTLVKRKKRYGFHYSRSITEPFISE